MDTMSRAFDEEPEIEFSVVCAHFGKDTFHQLHRTLKTSERTANQTVLDLNHKAELDVDKTSYYHACAPYRKQERPIVDWVDSE